MKKLFNATIALALSSMLFLSCSKSDDVVVKNEDVLVKATLIAGNPQADPGTKTEIQGTTPYWSVGDAVGVTNGVSTNAQFTSSITSPSTTATFSGETVSGDLFAYYPYSTAGVGTSGASIVLPAEQNPTATSFDGRADVLVSKMFTVDPENTTVSGLEFKRLSSVLKVVLKNNAGLPAGEHPTFVSLEAGSNLIGTALVNFASQSLSLESGSNKVTANYATPTIEVNGTDAAYLVVVPQTIAAGTTMTLKANTENYYIEKNITVPAGGIEILEGKITTLNIGLGSTNVTHHPVINVTSANPMGPDIIDNVADSYNIEYTIDDPLAGEVISASTDVAWISSFDVTTSGIVEFNVAAQDYNTNERTGHITLSYKDANDVVVTVTQKKGRILATLSITSGTNVNNLEDDKGNTWVCTTDNGVSFVLGYSGSTYFIQAGNRNNEHPSHLTLTLSGHSTYKIWAVQAWAASQVNALTHISIGGTQVIQSQSTLTDNAASGGTLLSVENNPYKTGDVEINIQKTGSVHKEHLYFNKLTILYDEN